MTAAENVLQKAAESGAWETEAWPETLEYILDRLDEIVSQFPRPTAPPAKPLSTTSNANSPPRPPNAISSQDAEAADKENAPPTTPPRPPVPAFAGTASATQPTPDLPQETITFYSSIRTALSKNFPKNPPHTIQRLAELILQPTRHYRFLPAYLRALDRVVSVSSPTTVFPLPQALLPSTGGLLNGTTSAQSTLGSDESLGGALLTPIPWLQNRGSQSELVSESTEMVEGPNGAGRIETVTVMSGTTMVSTAPPPQPQPPQQQIASSHPDGETLPYTGPVTQGELLRQEQEAGVVLSNPHSILAGRTTVGEMEGGGSVVETVEGEEETPHARGPELIGMEDTGPQKAGATLDIEGAVGRPSMDRASKSPGPAAGAETGPQTETEAGAEAEAKAGAEAEPDAKDEEMKDRPADADAEAEKTEQDKPEEGGGEEEQQEEEGGGEEEEEEEEEKGAKIAEMKTDA